MFFSGIDRADFAEPGDCAAGVAHGHRDRIFWGLHDVFETAKMLEAGEWLWATTYVAASVAFGLLLSVAGIRLANRF
jgi:hypothetical protein